MRIRVVVAHDDGEYGHYGDELSVVGDELKLSDLEGQNPTVTVVPIHRLVRVEIISGTSGIKAGQR